MNNRFTQYKNWKWSFDTNTSLYTAKHDNTGQIIKGEDYFKFVKDLDKSD
jgi:hypothetical protein